MGCRMKNFHRMIWSGLPAKKVAISSQQTGHAPKTFFAIHMGEKFLYERMHNKAGFTNKHSRWCSISFVFTGLFLCYPFILYGPPYILYGLPCILYGRPYIYMGTCIFCMGKACFGQHAVIFDSCVCGAPRIIDSRPCNFTDKPRVIKILYGPSSPYRIIHSVVLPEMTSH